MDGWEARLRERESETRQGLFSGGFTGQSGYEAQSLSMREHLATPTKSRRSALHCSEFDVQLDHQFNQVKRRGGDRQRGSQTALEEFCSEPQLN